MKKYVLIVLWLVLAGWLLSACQAAVLPATPTPEPPPPPTEKPPTWQTVLTVQSPPLMRLAGFDNSTFGITIGDDSQAMFTEDGGANWQSSKIDAFQLFGLDIVDRNTAWTCGNGATRVTTDGARTWQAASDFGNAVPDQCRFISFLDTHTGWAATSAKLVTTTDGATTWTDVKLPDGLDRIAAISLYAPGAGCLLAKSGALYCTIDDGKSWNQAGAPPLGDLTIAEMNPPVAAMRFTDSQHAIVILPSVAGGQSMVTAFHTADGGKSWTQETAATTFGFPVLSHDGRILTLFCLPYQILVLQYNG